MTRPAGVEGRWPQAGVWGWVRVGGTGGAGGRVGDHGGNLTSPNGPQPAQPPAQLSWTGASKDNSLSGILLAGSHIEMQWWDIGIFMSRRGARCVGGTSHICPTTNCSPHQTQTTRPVLLSSLRSQTSRSQTGPALTFGILASLYWGCEERLLRLVRWGVWLAAGTGGSDLSCGPATALTTLSQANTCILPGKRPAKYQEKKSCGWKMQTEWALNHKRQKHEIWQQNIKYQQ